MNFPLGFWDISLFLAVLSIILLPTSKLIPRYYGMVETLIRRLEIAALTVSALFLITVAVRLMTTILET
ncbi:MAG TPA: hypothetical protein VK209_13035 [Candidatus Sulfotelmatobacter sp.]|nr:hypothetical protein [Candidatus Sulfotelmatobacter sp.]